MMSLCPRRLIKAEARAFESRAKFNIIEDRFFLLRKWVAVVVSTKMMMLIVIMMTVVAMVKD